jgi:DUF4097 and DUF4098 domain-containing protein YvlB
MRMATVGVMGVCVAGLVPLAHGADESYQNRIAADPHGVVEISNVAGRIDVSAWDNPEVEVRAELGSGVDRIETKSESGRTLIKVIVPNHTFRSPSADLRVRVPRQSELDISGVSADVTTSDVEGPLQLKTVSGNVKADLYDKSAEIKTISGDVVLRGHGKDAGASIHVTSISGNVRIDRTAGDVDASSVSGDLTVRLEPTHPTRNVRVRTTSGDLGFEGRVAKGGYIDAETVSGDLTVRAVPESGLSYEVNTFSGDITNCMGVESERVSKYGPGHRLMGSKGPSGSDSVRVRLKTMSGDVELCDKN